MLIGGGKTGFYLAEMLAEFGAAVKIIEKAKKDVIIYQPILKML